jgi:hypothetical protein
MSKKRYRPEEIIAKLRETVIPIGQGAEAQRLAREWKPKKEK